MSVATAAADRSRMMPSRRAFLTGVLGGRAGASASSYRQIPAERIASLREIALRWETRLPQGAVPELRAGAACVGHGVCASVCPTGALRSYEDSGVTGIEFVAGECFACGACVVVCPEQALGLEARGAGKVPARVERVTHHALRMCAHCDDAFAARGEHELCPACRKDVELFTTGFSARSDQT